MNSKFLATVGDNLPTIMCEEHAKMFEKIMMIAEVPHTIYELDEDDGPYYCHACDLQVAKDYVKRREEQENQPRIILPGEFN